MAFDFDGSTDGYSGGSVATAYPISLSCWINSDSFAALGTLLTGSRTTAAVNHRIGMFCGVGGVANVTVVVQAGGTATTATGGTPSTGVWHHVAARITSANMFVYLDGTQAATNTHALAYPSVLVTDIGARRNGSATVLDFFNGRIAECAVWTADIGTAGVSMLAAGASPRLVFPNLLRNHWAMRSELNDCVGAADLAAIGSGGAAPSVAHVTRVFYPSDASNFPTRNRKIGAGASIIPMPVSAGTTVESFVGTGAAIIPMPVSTGTAVERIVGAGASVIPKPVSAGTAAVVVTGNGAATIPLPSSAGTIAISHMGSGAAIIPMPVSAGTGAVIENVTGSGASVIPLPVSEGTGLHQQSLTAAGDAVIPMPVSTGTAAVLITANGTSLIPMPVAAGAAIATMNLTAAGDAIIPMPVSEGTAAHIASVTAAGDAVIPLPVSFGSGLHTSATPTIAILPTILRLIVPAVRLVAVLSLRDLIDARIRQQVAAGPFNKVVHAPNGYRSSTLELAEPILVLTQETKAAFDTPKRNRRTFRDERQTWQWDLWLQFNVEVTLEAFEEAWVSDTPIVLYSGRPVAWLRLRAADYDQPAYQDPNSGTRARYVVHAEMAPT